MTVTAEQIAAAFAKRVERFGYRKTTVDEIAADLRVSKKTIYVHFAGKAEIYRFIVDRLAAETAAALRAEIAEVAGAGARFEAVARLVLAQTRAHVRATDAAEWSAEFTVAADAFRAGLAVLFREIVEAGIAAGELSVVDAATAVRLVGALFIEYAVVLREDPGFDGDEEFVAAARRFLG